MTPYYEHAGITIYHGDCREILPALPRADLVLTDPPYGIALDCDYEKRRAGRARPFRMKQTKKYANIRGDEEPLDFSHLWSAGDIAIVFGANNFPKQIPFDNRTCGWLCWDKRCTEAADTILGSPFELAVIVGRRTYRIIRLLHCVRITHGEVREHPTQKPSELMARILAIFPHASTIIDPFMGSGTTLIAAKNLGRKAIGIEIEESYCALAAARLGQEVMSFTSKPEPIAQGILEGL